MGLQECVFDQLILFTELTVHACNMFIHLKLVQQLVIPPTLPTTIQLSVQLVL